MNGQISDKTKKLRSLFNNDTPNNPIMFAGLEGRVNSTILTDNDESPTKAVIRTPEGLTFYSQSADMAFVRGTLRKLQHVGPVMVVVEDRPEFFPKPDVVIPRYQFASYDSSRGPKEIDLPDGFRIVPMSKQLMTECNWRSLIELSYGNIESFLEVAFGYCLVDGEQILTETYAAFIGDGAVEIGVITGEAFRGKGYGTIAATYLVKEIQKRGLEPYWSCDQSNEVSVALARKIGFTELCEYAIQGYRPLKTPDLKIE